MRQVHKSVTLWFYLICIGEASSKWGHLVWHPSDRVIGKAKYREGYDEQRLEKSKYKSYTGYHEHTENDEKSVQVYIFYIELYLLICVTC